MSLPSTARADGLLLVDKPAGVTSHDVVARARRVLRERRIGHLGTLDPFATGLLVLLVGRATRLAQYLDGEPKEYAATVSFGAETETDDGTGAVTVTAPLPAPADVRRAIEQLTGPLQQMPPAYSAKQVDGERSYAAARAGRALALRAVPVQVHGWQVEQLTPERAQVRVTCSGGTYVRALARDLGRRCGSAAHLTALRRLRSGPFQVADAVSWDALEPAAPPALRSPLPGLAAFAPVPLGAEELERVLRGAAIPAHVPGDRAVLLDEAGEVVAVAQRVQERWQPRAVLRDG